MEKNKKISKSKISPEEALQFLEDFRNMRGQIDEATVPVSVRIPKNILRALKFKAQTEGKKYQSLLVEYLRQALIKKENK